MKTNRAKQVSLALCLALLLGGAAALGLLRPKPTPSLLEREKIGAPHLRSSFSPRNPDDAVSRGTYEQRRLRDPRTGRIPAGIRARELAFAQRLPRRDEQAQKAGDVYAQDWTPRGPVNVGGRTRALAIDLGYNGTTNRRILAGGVSGGMFRSEDGGASWQLVTSLADHASVTSIVQDPNDRDVWYYGTGELTGNSASGGGAFFFGHGLFKSLDGGATWAPLPSTVQENRLTVFDRFFDFVWNLAIHPQTSALYAATFGGLLRSTDGGASWQLVLGREEQPFSAFTDVTLGADGSLYATLSRNGGEIADGEYGVFRSTDGGDTWTDITPAALVADPHRMVLGAAPSDAGTVYLLVQATERGAGAAQHQFFRYDAAAGTWNDLSANLQDLPVDFDFDVGLWNSQGGYNLVVAVKPDDPDAVWVGATNLYRSRDGGQTFDWVGGYHPQEFFYPDHHPDQHALAFYPNDPDALISGHDGGLSRTNRAFEQPQTWVSLNNGYLTSQFYAVAVDPAPGSDLVFGGMQDNGSWGTESPRADETWSDLLSGDGGFAAAAPGGLPFYVSAQLGAVYRVAASPSGEQLTYTLVQPASADDFLFITPYELDPNDPRVMYLAAGNLVWRNRNLDAIPAGNADSTDINWRPLTNAAVGTAETHQVTALAVSKTPADRLYFGATDFEGQTQLVRVDDPATNPAGQDVTPPGIIQGSYPSSIALNPDDADELIATFSNYGVPGLWHSTDGGATWSNVEGNLGGEDGPSVRWAAVAPGENGTRYFLATSTGVYAAATLNGPNTTWVQEAEDTIGNVVVSMLRLRPEDRVLVAATHGRGVYSVQLSAEPGGPVAVAAVEEQQLELAARAGETASAGFALRNTGAAPLSYTAFVEETGAAEASLAGGRSLSGRADSARFAIAPERGTVPPGSRTTLTVTFDATDTLQGSYQGIVNLTTNGGDLTIPVEASVSAPSDTGRDVDGPLPLRLEQNVPNPFASETVIQYTLPMSAQVSLRVFDVRGRYVAELDAGMKRSGSHEVRWRGQDALGNRLASGVYLCRLEVVPANGQRPERLVQKMLLLR